MTVETGGADPGLFGPGSLTWRIHADPILWVGGLRALFLQALHPAALAGVFTRSDYRADPWGRLFRTADYVGAVTYDTTVEAEAAGARVREVHAALGLEDPELLRWVHCCEVGSFLDVYRRAGGGLADSEADRYLTEQLAAARLVGLDPAEVPASTGELADYFDRMRPDLAGGSDARAIARFLVIPPMPARVRYLTPALPAWATVSTMAFGTLPRWGRRLYGIPAPPGSDLTVGAALRALRLTTDRLPERLREGPHLRAARARMGPTVSI